MENYVHIYRLNSVDQSIIASLNARGVNLFGLNLFGDAAVNRYLLSIVGNNERAVGRVYNPSALLLNNTAAVRQLSSFISNSKYITKFVTHIYSCFQVQHRNRLVMF
jgi:hypothetical protein